MKLFRPLIIMLFAALLITGCNKQGGGSSGYDKQQIQQIVHNYLLDHPQILVQVGQKLQAQQQQKMQKMALSAIKAHSAAIFSNPHTLVAGNTHGNASLVEFFDYQCVHCSHMYPIVQSLIKANKNLRVVLKEFPIFGPASQYAAAAALAAAKQGKGLQMHDALFKSGLIEGKMTKAAIIKIAKKVGLNIAKLQKDMASASVQNEIKNNYKLAQYLAIRGTPAFVIAPTPGTGKGKTTFIPGASTTEQLQDAIDKA